MELSKRFKNLKVRDVMSSEIVSIPGHSTLSEAAGILCNGGVTGAPVVDELGRCVGLLAMSDIGRRVRLAESCEERYSFGREHRLMRDRPDQPWTIQSIATDSVTRYMVRDVHMVLPDLPLMEAGRRMCEYHVHRLVVTESGGPIGMITSLDLTATLIQGVEEADSLL